MRYLDMDEIRAFVATAEDTSWDEHEVRSFMEAAEDASAEFVGIPTTWLVAVTRMLVTVHNERHPRDAILEEVERRLAEIYRRAAEE